jgi:Holliday junction resolvasome RuvABC endonuclease subunit
VAVAEVVERGVIVLAIDPGPTRSAWLVLRAAGDQYDGVTAFATWTNDELLRAIRLREFTSELTHVVLEKVESFGMAVGAEVFETVHWTGRFAEAADFREHEVGRIGRKAVKIHLCGSMRAKDANIRQALIDRFATSSQPAIGVKRRPGPLYGVTGDVWSALAVAVTWADTR